VRKEEQNIYWISKSYNNELAFNQGVPFAVFAMDCEAGLAFFAILPEKPS
jgi:hypothetical protein